MSTVGQSVPRADGPEKVTGRAVYVDDLTFPDMLYGVTIRSTEPHARLDEIVWSPDFDWSRVTRVTAADIPGKNVVYLMEYDQPALVKDVIRHAEEPVALVAAESRELAEEARRHVTLKTTPLPPIFDVEESIEAKAPIYGSDNVFKRIDIKKGECAEALSKAALVFEGTYRTGYQEQMYIEPQGMIAMPSANGGVTLYGSLQCPYYVVKGISPLLALEPEQVRVIQCVTGGGFGGKEEYPSMIGAHAALLAMKARHPVKIIYDRAEDIAATTKRHPSVVRHRTAVDEVGRLIAMDIDIILDGGAYLTLSPVVLSRSAIHGTGPYECDNVSIRARVVATHTPPCGAFRGFGAPQVCFAIERHIDHIAGELGLTPLEIRRNNLLKVGAKTVTGQVLKTSVGMDEALETVVARSNYEKRYQELSVQPPGQRIRKGVGLSCTLHGAGFTGAGELGIAGKVDVETTPEGGVTVFSGSTDMGQGATTVFTQIAAEALGLETSLVNVAQPDTANVPDSGPTVASRTTMVVGKVCEDACMNLVEAMKPLIAQKAEIAPEAITFENGAFSWDGGQLDFSNAAAQIHEAQGTLRVRGQFIDRDHLKWDMETYTGDAYSCYGWEAVVAEVDVDMDTYIPNVTKFYSATDIGRAINPVMVTGQIEGGSLQGLGFASMEEVRMVDGRYFNHRMTDCIIPTALDAPEMDTAIIEEPYEHGPGGAKGVGEMPMDLPAPAMAAAMEQATGVFISEVPFTPEMLCVALAREEGEA